MSARRLFMRSIKSRRKRYEACDDVVPLTGLEPVRMLLRRILSDAPHADLRGT